MARHSRQVPISSKNNRKSRAAHARATKEFKTYDTSAIRPKRSKAPAIIALVVIAVAATVVAAILAHSCSQEQEVLPSSEEAVIEVSDGESAKDVAATLYEARLIPTESEFTDLVDARDAGSSIIPGTYLFKGGTSADEILDALMEGPASTADSLTVPEGATREAISKDVEKATDGRITAQQFMDATAKASDYAGSFTFLATAGDNSLEGFLFPKTYDITATDDATDVVKMMLGQFGNETDGLDMAYPESKGLDLYGVVKLASIVQKEGVVDNYRKVASVFYNRLASDEPFLQSDATTAYEVGHDPTAEEVHADTPYSTYAHEGLPPTPICNPSLEAMAAVCSPEQTDYMYFYTHDDGTYSFSKTYEEHQEAID